MELGHLRAVAMATVTTHHSPFQLRVQGSHLSGGFLQFPHQLVPLAVQLQPEGEEVRQYEHPQKENEAVMDEHASPRAQARELGRNIVVQCCGEAQTLYI